MKKFFDYVLYLLLYILVIFILKNKDQIYDFFFEERIIYLCKYEKELNFYSCNIAANLEKQRYDKLGKEAVIYSVKGDSDEFNEKIQNTVNNILRYRYYSCNRYIIDEYYKKNSIYYQNLKHCREFYEDYLKFCRHYYYKDCHNYSFIIEEGQKLYK